MYMTCHSGKDSDAAVPLQVRACRGGTLLLAQGLGRRGHQLVQPLTRLWLQMAGLCTAINAAISEHTGWQVGASTTTGLHASWCAVSQPEACHSTLCYSMPTLATHSRLQPLSQPCHFHAIQLARGARLSYRPG